MTDIFDPDIVERLLDMHGGVPESYVGKLRAEAAAEVKKLRAEVERLRAEQFDTATRQALSKERASMEGPHGP